MLFTVMWLPTAASAAGNIVIKYMNIGSCALQVELSDGNGLILKSMTVHIYSGTKDVYDATNMAYAAGPANDQVWNATGPISQANLAAGTYTLTVDATDADETDLGLPSPDAPITISYSTKVTAVASPATLGYGDTSTTISGKVSGTRTCDTTSVGMSGVPIDLSDVGNGSPAQIATTQSDGSYSAQVQLPNVGDTYEVAALSGAMWQGSSTFVPVTWAQQEASRLRSVKVTPQDASYNGTATLTGTAQADNAVLGWQPLQDYPVSVRAGSTPATVMTNALGQFSWTYPTSDGTGWYAHIGDGTYLRAVSAIGSIHVAVPLRFRSLSASLSPFARLAVTACVQAIASGFAGPAGRLQVQYSARQAGPWTTLGWMAPAQRNAGRSCSASTQSGYRGTVAVRLARAYYRAYLGATSDNQAVASAPVLRWKYVTRIIAVHVTPSTVRHGGKITVSGRLQTYNRTWLDYAHQQVLIILRPQGSKTWYWIVKVRTTPPGTSPELSPTRQPPTGRHNTLATPSTSHPSDPCTTSAYAEQALRSHG
jgi:hypothetical protein